MHPEETQEQAELKASVERFWRAQVSPEKLLAWGNDPAGVDADMWRSIGELGWFGIGISPERGGSGLGLIEVACVVEEGARGLLPRRVIGAIRGAVALGELEPEAPELESMATGVTRLTLAFDERHARSVEHLQTRVQSGRLSGEKWCVPDPSATWHLVSARDDDGVVLALVDGAQASVAPLRTFDGGEQGVVTYSEVAPVRVLAAGPPAGAILLRLQRTQTALALAEMLGGMRAALDATVAYVQEREQFGQKIAVFQAVQHQIADMALAQTAARHLAWRAISRLAHGTEEGTELATAAAFVARAFKDVTMSAHHLHGGAGYVVEHPLHFHSERAQALAIRYAPEAEALDEVARDLLDRP